MQNNICICWIIRIFVYMSTLTNEQAIKFVKDSTSTPSFIQDARDYYSELKALIDGKGYESLLIKIDHVESDKKQKSRERYSFSMKDMFSRLFKKIDNVWTATGGSKFYDLEDDEQKLELAKAITQVRGGKSIEQWNKDVWMKVLHTDPAGVTFLEYDAEKDISPFPTYKSIEKIRNYITNGVNLEVILFEPKTIKRDGDQKDQKTWRLVDDLRDIFIIQTGDEYLVDEEKTFEHPFGQCPALINSDDVDPEDWKRLSPIDPSIDLCKEYLRDKSIKTIYKFLQGFPLFWRYTTQCEDCTGTGKKNNQECGTCDGHGYIGRRDITDTVNLPIPKDNEVVLAPNIAGWLTPPLDIWQRYDDELKLLEVGINVTHWGTITETEKKSNTATGRMLDVQPIIQTLDSYSSKAEIREKKITDWIANYLFIDKNKDQSITTIAYGRDYAILPSSTLLEIYERAKASGDNSTILDRLLDDVLISRYKNDPLALQLERIKSSIDPYIHYTVEQVNDIFGNSEAQKKMLFPEWWDTITVTTEKESGIIERLKSEFDEWYTNKTPSQSIESEIEEQTNTNT
jgi:hypothetical protein